MKIITISDIHGRDCWKKINFNKYDKIIFIGDYVDSFYYTGIECLHNLKNIVEFKEKNYDRVELLLGNHDIHYMWLDNLFKGDGFDPAMIYSYQEHFFNYDINFKVAYQLDNYLWTHAGISSWWKELYIKDVKLNNIGEHLNNMMIKRVDREQLFKKGYGRIAYVDSNNLNVRSIYGPGGPVWAHKTEISDYLQKDIHQIVGHTNIKEIEHIKFNENTSITYTDCLAFKEDYYILEI